MPRDGRDIVDTGSSSSVPNPDLEAGAGPQPQIVICAQTESTSLPVEPLQSQPQRELAQIPRVRGLLRAASSDHFTPQFVSIGPYHADQEGSYLPQSTRVKAKYVQYFIEKGVDHEGLKTVVSELVAKVRACYTHLPENITMNDNDGAFCEMLLLDGCYLLCHLIDFATPGAGSSSSGGSGSSSSGVSGSNDGGGSGGGSGSISSGDNLQMTRTTHEGAGASLSRRLVSWCRDMCSMLHGLVTTLFNGKKNGGGGGEDGSDQMRLDNDNTLVRDILYLLENQIPLLVLEKILEKILYCIISRTHNVDNALNLIYKPVREVLVQRQYISKKYTQLVPSSSEPSDLLHLVYSYFRRGPDDVVVPPARSAQPRFLKSTGRWRRATDYLKYADLKFKCRKFKEDQEWTILDLRMDGGTLYIPFLQVNPDTCTMLRNLMALEEQEKKRPVTAYCLFMSQVACTAEDVQLLQKAGILQHFMPNDEAAANALANLCDGVIMNVDSQDRNYLKHLWHVLDKRCGKLVSNFKGFFREKYCSTVFYRLVFFVAFLVFLSELTQAIYAVIAYHKPSGKG